MKKLILFYLFFLSVSAFSQDYDNPSSSLPVPATFKTYGYIGGTRLDSVDAQFAEFDWGNSEEVTFEYGQNWKKRKELIITDNQGTPLSFSTKSQAFLLNFFYFNRWQPVQTYISGGETRNMLRKN